MTTDGNNVWGDHLCGSPYAEKHCEHLRYVQPSEELNGKKIDNYCVYCLVGKRPRKISAMSTWTGLTPKWCPKRQNSK